MSNSCATWAPTSSSGAATTWPRGSARSSRRGSTGWPTARCRTRSCCPPSGTAALSRPCGGYRGDGQRDVRMFPTLVRRVAEDRPALDRLRRQAEDGVLTLRVAQTFPADKAAEAHRLLERGGVRGRLVLTF